MYLGGLDAVHHKAQFVGLELRLCDVVAPPFGIIDHGNAEIIMEPDNVIVDGFGGCFNGVGSKELLNSICVLGMLLCGVGVEEVPDVEQFHTLPGGTPAPCRPFLFLLLVQFPNPFVYFFPAQSPLFIVCHRCSSCGGFCVSIAYQK